MKKRILGCLLVVFLLTLLTASLSAAAVDSDDFSSTTLDTGRWTFVNPKNDAMLTMSGTHLIISVPGGTVHDATMDSGGGLTAPRLRQAVGNASSFEVEVKFDSTVAVYEVIQGIIIEQDSNDYIRFDFYYDGTSTHIYSTSFINGALGTIAQGRKNTVISTGPIAAPLYLRVKRTGDTFTLTYSTDGTTWTTHHTFNRTMTVNYIGPYAGNPLPANNPPAFTLLVDYFFNTASPIVPQDGPDTTPPVIDVWYGLNQTFGQIGIPQHSADILGNASDPSLIASLAYSLNGGAQIPLTVGPNGNRLQSLGDFNADIPFGDGSGTNGTLWCGNNAVVITAIDNFGNTASESVNVNYSCNNYWPESYSIDWSTVTNIQDVAQVVDGVWAIENGSVHPVILGYDRLIAVGDIDPSWDDYEVTVPVTFYNLDSTVPWGPFVGFMLRWQGHYDWGGQPRHGWWPTGALGGYDWHNTDLVYKLHILGNNGVTIAKDNSGRLLSNNVPYIFKMRVETVGTTGTYSLKVWQQGSAEPAGWDISGQGPAAELKYGSVLLVSHYADVDFGNVSIVPSPFGQDTTPPSISNIQAAPSATTATITWTTNEGATSRVQYGPTAAYESVAVEDTTRKTFHSITLTNLIPQATYHYKVTSADASNNSAGSADLTFTTTSVPSAIVSDDFSGPALNTSLWTFINPKSDATLIMTGTQASISVPAGVSHDVLYTGNSAPRLMQSANNGNFEIEVKFESSLSGYSSLNGIIVQQDGQNFIRFDFYSTATNTLAYAEVITPTGGVMKRNLNIGSAPSAAPLFMRVKRVGNQWTQSYSFNGTNWTQAVTFTQALTVTAIGTHVGNAMNNPAYTGLIDYFFNTASPIVPGDGEAPVITTQPLAQSVTEGNTAIFSVAAVGPGTLTYQWYRGESPIPGATNASYTTGAVVYLNDNNAIYYCVITNTFGSTTTTTATLTVTPVAPYITTQPLSQTVNQGQAATFSVLATGMPTLSYQWQKNGDDIPLATSPSYTTPATSFLSDNGASFTCVVKNIAGSATSSSATLTIDGIAPIITTPPANRTVNDLTQATFSVVAVGPGTLTYQWQKDGSPISGATGASYTTPAVVFNNDNNAKYSCVVSNGTGNGHGPTQSAEATLIITPVAPSITTQPQSQTVNQGQTATFSVVATGTAPFTYQWKKNGEDIPLATALSYTTPATSFLTDNNTTYTCVVTNIAGPTTSGSATLNIIGIAPIITTEPANRIVNDLTQATFSVVAVGPGTITYQWKRGVVDIPGATEATYTTPAVVYLSDNNANYSCVVTNAVGSTASAAATLTVTPVAPSIMTQPSSQTVNQGQTATFSVVATGTAPFSYQWKRNGVEVPGANGSSYTTPVTSFLADNGAAFTCVVTGQHNLGNATTNPATLNITGIAPIITAGPVDTNVSDLAQATFSVEAVGPGILTYQWQRNGANLPGAASSTYMTPPVTFEADNGATYRCLVTNAFGTTFSYPATLTVVPVVPQVLVQPSSQNVTEGNQATFTVEVTGTAPLSYKWRKNNGDIPGATGASYTTPPATLADNFATFICIVTNTAGSVASDLATLFVNGIPPTITTQPANKTVNDGQTATFSVVASGPALSYQWKKNGNDIPGATGSSYTTPPAIYEQDNNASYLCVVSNYAGSATSAPAKLTVTPLAPTITGHPQNSVVNDGQSVTFSVTASGTAPFTYQWKRAGQTISGAANATYTIDKAALSDDWATFLCVVTNTKGSATSNAATLQVNPVPPSITTPASKTVIDGQPVTFSVVAAGSAPLSFKWKKNGEIIPGATNDTYTIPATVYQNDNSKTFSCEVTNAPTTTGTATASATLNVTPIAPTIISQPVGQSVIAGSSVTFSVAASGTAPLSYRWQKDGMDIGGATGSSHTISSVSLTDNGSKFRCIVSNVTGTSATSEEATLTVSPDYPIITAHPASTTVKQGETAEFKVVATGPNLTYKWFKNGQPINGVTAATYITPPVDFVADNGAVFSCEVSNASNTVATSNGATLHVTTAPIITAGPVNATVVEDAPASFSVTVAGPGPFGYQWLRNGAAQFGENAATYTIPAVTFNDNGDFISCWVTNAFGTTPSNTATLYVSGTPPGNVLLDDVTVQDGQSATFEVITTGTILSYEWYRVTDLGSALIPGENGPTYTISETVYATDDQSRYQCVVRGLNGSSKTSRVATLRVTPLATAITGQPQPVAVPEGQTATFTVTATGTPPVSYQWYRETGPETYTPIPDAVDSSYTTAATVRETDNGALFKCFVSGPGGDVWSDAATLTVDLAAPSIEVQPAAQTTVYDKDTVTLTVEATGSAPLTYQWMRVSYAGEVRTLTPIEDAIEPTYAFTASYPADNGATFVCIVANEIMAVEAESQEAVVTVLPLATQIIVQPANKSVPEDQKATFSVTAGGSNLTYQWYRGSDAISGETGASYETPTTVYATDNNATFRCEVSGSGGTVMSSAATLTVTGIAPVITSEPQDAVVTDNQQATFSLTATGTEPLSYQWYRKTGLGTTLISNATSATYETPATVYASDNNARYYCVVSNVSGATATSREAVLTVNPRPAQITSHPVGITVTDGGTALFSIAATGTEPLSYQWYRGTEAISNATGTSYSIPAVVYGTHNNTSYHCEVSGPGGPATSNAATLTVTPVGPTITADLQDQAVTQGLPVTFSVVATGSAPLSYQWLRDGQPISDAPNASDYTIQAVTADDHNARFQCVVTGPHGVTATSSEAILTVIDPAAPLITVHPATETTVEDGGTVTLSVEATGSAPLSYEWNRVGIDENNNPVLIPIEAATDSTYVFTAVYPADNGAKFVCVATNSEASAQSTEALLTVTPVELTVIDGPQSVTVQEGQTATFSVTVSGSAPRTYRWFDNGLKVYEGPNASYTTPQTTLADNGHSFTCEVSNDVNTIQCGPATLTVDLAPPTIKTHPQSATVADGQSVTFSVAAEGSATLSYRWQRGDVNIDGATEATYTLSAAYPSDNGAKFRCLVTNGTGVTAASNEATLTVGAIAPTIKTQPQSVSVTDGGTATFSVEAEGSATLEYQWQRNGLDISGATSRTYTLSAVYPGDDGAKFRCVVTNTVSSVTSNQATLTVGAIAPTIKTHPQGMSVTDGGRATFSVVAEGSATLEYQWQRNGENIGGATSQAYSHSAVYPADNGATFRCVVTNAAGSITSNAAPLTVNAIAPSISTHPVSVTVNQGQPATFSVAATGSVLSYQWQKDGVNISGAQGSSYTIPAVNFSTDEGAKFRCLVSNEGIPASSVTSDAATLTISGVAPTITSQPVNKTVNDGETATFTVSATGSALLSYQWKRGSSDIAGAYGPSYTIPAVSYGSDNLSTYVCVVTNGAGSKGSNAATLSVTPLGPSFTTQPVSLTVTDGQEAVFSVEATGTAPLSYQWKKNGSPIPNANERTYRIPETVYSRDNGGIYTCTVTNNYGIKTVTSTAANLIVTPVAPTIMTHPVDATVTGGQTATFTVQATGTAPLSYQWKRNGVNVGTNNNAYTTPVTDFLTDNGAQFTCTVTNLAGNISSQTATLSITGVAPIITTQPVSKVVNDGQPVTFSIAATGPGSLSYQWYRGDSVIGGETGASLTIAQTDYAKDNGATFKCVVTNATGNTESSTVTLTVTPTAPSITTHPSNVSVEEGATATFSVSASGTAPLYYQWKKDGTVIDGATEAAYTTPPTSRTDSGSYFSCVVRNADGVTAESNNATLTVSAVAPTVTTHPANATVQEGATATFTVAASGTAPFSYQWKRNNVNVGTNSSTYTTPPTVFSSDNGTTYYCVVTNEKGDANSNAAILTVTPTETVITSHPQAVTVTENTTATFTVAATGSAPLSYQWYRGSAPISNATGDSYTTPAVIYGADNNASYYCVVTGPGGTQKSNAATLMVTPIAPAITSHPANATVTEGQTVSFSVSATGTEPLSYQWKKNGETISGETGPTYVIPVTTLADNGSSFSCVVTNVSGSPVESNGALLTVKAVVTGPTVTLQPASQSITEGQTATFSVVATGTGTLSYQWQKNGVNIGTNSPNYTTPATTVADSGATYQCIVQDSIGNATSMGATLTVSAGGTGLGPNILTNPGFESGTTPWVFFTNGAGTYQNNAAGDGSAKAAQINITTQGTNVQLYQPMLALEANTKYRVSFKAYSNTGHDLTVRMQKGVSPYTNYGLNSPAFNLGTTWKSFSIEFTTSGFTGTVSDAKLMLWMSDYDAANDHYYIDDVVLAKVTSGPVAPSITTHPANQTVTQGQTAIFNVVASGAAPLSYQWQKNGVSISGATTSAYTTPPTTLGDNGSTYRCVVSNTVGSVTSSPAILTVSDGSPEIATHPANRTVTEGQTATFSIVATGAAPLSYQWQKNGVDITGATSASYTTQATILTDSGATYRCVVSNAAGSATSNSASLTVNDVGNGPVIIVNPANQAVTEGQTATFSVLAAGTAPLSYQWQKNGGSITGATGANYTTPATVLADSGAAFQCVVSDAGGSVASNAAALTVTAGGTALGSNLIVNPGFETGTTPWKFATNGAGTFLNNAIGDGSAKAAHITITTQGTSVQLYQTGLSLEANTKYLLSFKAWSNTGHDLQVKVFKGVSPYTNYGLSNYLVNLGTSWQSYSVEFTTSGFSGTVKDGELQFWLAPYDAANDHYYFDDVAVQKVTSGPTSPSITTHPANKTVIEGQTATFSVAATGTAPLSYQWQKDGVAISGQTGASYTTPATALSDNGLTYRCVVSNSAGNVTSSSAILAVSAAGAPAITAHPSDQAVTVTQTATFSVVASGTAPLSYQWQKDGVDISGATSESYTTPATALSDNGSTYRCVVSNSLGSVTSTAATLTVTADSNLLTNPGFETGTAPWVFSTNGVGTYLNDAAGDGSAKAAHISITTPGTNVGFSQGDLVMEANTRYRVSFKAYSNTGHDLEVRVNNADASVNYGLPLTAFNLTASWQTFSVEFTASGFTGTVNDGKLAFRLNAYDAAGDNYYIDDVVLEKVTTAPGSFVFFDKTYIHTGENTISSDPTAASWDFVTRMYMEPGIPTNWVSPVDYAANGKYRFRVEVLEMDPVSSNVQIQFGWRQFAVDPLNHHFASPPIKFASPGVYEITGYLRDLKCYVSGTTSSGVFLDGLCSIEPGWTGWDWTNAFGNNTFYTVVNPLTNVIKDGDGFFARVHTTLSIFIP